MSKPCSAADTNEQSRTGPSQGIRCRRKRAQIAKAAETLGTSRRTIAELQERVGQRLLNPTTRSVATTEASARLFAQVAPALDTLETAMTDANAVAGAPAGRLRLNVGSLAAREYLAPLLPAFLQRHPAISVEVVSEDRLVDMVGAGFDSGIRLGDGIERDMVAVPIGPKLRMRVVAAPVYLAAARRLRLPSDLHLIRVSICARRHLAGRIAGNCSAATGVWRLK
jgi:DNA-binding transcriptional LysR family regulator